MRNDRRVSHTRELQVRSQASASDASVRHHRRCGRRANSPSFERQGPRPPPLEQGRHTQSQLLTLSGACASPHQTSKSSAASSWRRQDHRELLKSLRCRIAWLPASRHPSALRCGEDTAKTPFCSRLLSVPTSPLLEMR